MCVCVWFVQRKVESNWIEFNHASVEILLGAFFPSYNLYALCKGRGYSKMTKQKHRRIKSNNKPNYSGFVLHSLINSKNIDSYYTLHVRTPTHFCCVFFFFCLFWTDIKFRVFSNLHESNPSSKCITRPKKGVKKKTKTFNDQHWLWVLHYSDNNAFNTFFTI